MTTLLISCSQ